MFHFDRNIDKYWPFFSKLSTLFLSQIQKNRYLHCDVKFLLGKLGCALTWCENDVPQLRNCVALQLNEEVRCGSFAALQKLKKLNCTFCAALLDVEKIVALCCAALLIHRSLCPPLRGSMYNEYDRPISLRCCACERTASSNKLSQRLSILSTN